MAALDSLTEMSGMLEEWNRDHNSSTFNTISVLHRMAQLIEKETEAYYKMDPDPFDDRHPGRANPSCAVGHLMKALFKNEDFMNKLVSLYLMTSNRDQTELHTAACRLLLDVLPGLETSIVFQETDGLVRRLLHWAENADDPLRSYATGLLAGAMELQDVANNFKDTNNSLVPLMLRRLRDLKIQFEKESEESAKSDESRRHFAMFSKRSPAKGATPEKQIDSKQTTPDKGHTDTDSTSVKDGAEGFKSPKSDDGVKEAHGNSSRKESHYTEERRMSLKRALSPSYYSEDIYQLKRSRTRNESFGECSGSSWAEMQPYVIGTYCLEPLSTAMKQRLILQYLTPMGEYQELISMAFEYNVLDLIFYYIDLSKNTDVRLAFEALRYVAILVCHKKFAIEFLSIGGVQRLLEVPHPSMAATGVSLCLYYLSYFEDAMERVCLLPDHVLSDLVSYTLWLLECSHDSSRCHAAMFFSQAFPFRLILDLFDNKDGLRRLFNVISTLPILNVEDRRDINEDELFTMRQLTRHVTLALKKYFEAHLSHKVDEIKRSHARSDLGSPVQETPAYKALKLTPEIVQENIEIMMELMPVRLHWDPDVTFHKLGGIGLLCQLVAMAPEWHSYTGKPETIKNALDVINVCVVTPKSQLALLESVPLPDSITTPAISVLIGLAEGEIIADPEVQKSALNVIINCVCGPVERLGGGMGRFMGTGSKRRINLKMGEDVLSRMWNGVRINNGIMMLLKLLSVKTPITDADCIRALACRALVGLSRSETVRQIISKLPLFNNGQIQLLMKEPVLHDKQQEHVKFCKYSNDLLERVLGKRSSSNFDASLEDIRRADIVAQTRITFQEKELLQLIHNHLQAKGLADAAAALQREANLPRCSTPPNVHPQVPQVYSSPHIGTPKSSRQLSHQMGHAHGSLSTSALQSSSTSVFASPSGTNSNMNSQKESPTSSTPGTPGPIRFTMARHAQSPAANPAQTRATNSRCRFISEKDANLSSLACRSKGSVGKIQGEYEITLDKIVTEYLRKQHALCRNPVTTCPPMSLFNPHRCPEPQGKYGSPFNVTARLNYRMQKPRYGGLYGASTDRKFIYSRFRPCQSYRNSDEGGYLCCSFSADEQSLLFGTYWGDVKITSLQSGEETGSFTCHSSPISDLQPSRDGKLLLTSYSGSGSGVWKYGDNFENKYSFDDEHIEFSKHIQDRIIGTKEETAHIYDVLTGKQILKLYDANNANNYRDNRATFNATDDLVLNDGVLWDIRSGKCIHKFDKFNSNISGTFHPMDLEIIINSEVWDIRTYHLLHTVPALSQCSIRFNSSGDIIYAIHMDEDLEYKVKSPYSSTFRTFDAREYTSIATIDVKSKSILDLCTDKADCYLAVVEQNTGSSDLTAEESYVCKLYEIGKLRNEEDDQTEDEDEGLEEDDDDDDDDEDDDLLNGLDDSNEDGDDDDEENNDDDDNDVEEFSLGSDDDDDDNLDDDILFELM